VEEEQMTRRRDKSEPNHTTATFAESPVSFPSADGAVTLAGTLATPGKGRTAPAVVLVSGTGQMDRDVTFVGHALFRVLAHALARAGIASLRFDKRGVGESGGDFPSAGPEEFVADVLGATAYLVDQEGFASECTGLLGHSEGGLVALTAASRMRRLPFCVLLASPLLSGRDNVVQMFALLASGSFQRDGEFDQNVADLTKLLEIARTDDAAERDLRALEIATRLAPHIFNDGSAVILGSNNLSGAEFLGLLSSNCLETCLSWEPSSIVPLVTCPVLVVYASKDVQAPARENLEAARALLGRLQKNEWEIREMADLNHAFQRCTTGMPDEYASIDHVMADEVLDEVAAWINARIPR
jgi:pimeloyl-ACP methyl ester carboxylesterase